MSRQNKRPDRREFLKQVSAGATLVAASSTMPSLGHAGEATKTPESLVKTLYGSLSESQREEMCFAWDFMHPSKGLLRTRVENNWSITKPEINDDFYTDDQRDIVRSIFEGIISSDWHERMDRQLDDDMGGWGNGQHIAIFGDPNRGKSEFVLTGRHITLRCDGDSTEHVAFGGPIFYGHAVDENESSTHEGNVFWPQAVKANGMYSMLDGRQREMAQVARTPRENKVAFRSPEEFTGIPVSEMSSDQQEHLQKVLQTLIEPYRQSDRDEVVACLKAQGGLEKCNLAFYTDHDIGKDQVWDNWRLEGPSFVWHFRGSPHVHVWVNVADDPRVKLNA